MKLRISMTPSGGFTRARIASSTHFAGNRRAQHRGVPESSMNTGDCCSRKFRALKTERSGVALRGIHGLIMSRMSAENIFCGRGNFRQRRRFNTVALPVPGDLCWIESGAFSLSGAGAIRYFSSRITAPLRASCHAWAIIPGRRLLRHHARSPNMRP